MATSTTFEEIAHAVRQLPSDEKAALAEMLFDELGSGQFASKEIESAWMQESENRLDAYLRGELEAIDGDVAMAKIRASLK